MLPGARGCTPQSCAFRNHFAELRALGASHLFGLSTQTTDYQKEAAERLHLPFALLSDSDFRLIKALRLPTFEIAGMRLLKRLTMVISEHRIEHVFYPVFSPDRSASDVVEWLRSRADKRSPAPRVQPPTIPQSEYYWFLQTVLHRELRYLRLEAGRGEPRCYRLQQSVPQAKAPSNLARSAMHRQAAVRAYRASLFKLIPRGRPRLLRSFGFEMIRA
jgi:peroxiredoxin